MGQDAYLNCEGDPPAHRGDEQIPVALEPVLGPPGRALSLPGPPDAA